jgi:hypothetical protein
MNRCKHFFLLVTSLLTISLMAACGSMEEKKKQDALHTTLSLYENSLRWHGIDKQGQFLKDKSMNPHNPGIRVVGYESSPAVTIDESTVSVIAQIQYLYNDTQSVRTISDRQFWESSENGQVWLRANPPPTMPR